MKKRKISLIILLIFIFLFWEFLFRLLIVKPFFSWNIIYIILYDLFLVYLVAFLLSFFREKGRKIFVFFLTLLGGVWYSVEFIFQKTFHVYFSLTTILFADQAVSFPDKIISLICHNILAILGFLLPLIIVVLCRSKINYLNISHHSKYKEKALMLCYGAFCYLIFLVCLFMNMEQINSPYSLYYQLNNNALNKETFGVVPSVLLEIRKKIFSTAPVLYSDNTDVKEEENYSLNVLDIPFDSFIQNTSDDTLKNMHTYFKSANGTMQNEYTGYFKDKNLILIMAESFNSIGVSETLTPTLYKLTHNGFVFENFYSPVILSTIGGEFQELTGLYPDLSTLSQEWRDGNNYFPYGYGSVFKNLGYSTFAYHDHRYTFQNRDLYLKSLGFTNYLGCGNGLEKRINCQSWPESDVEMISSTVNDFIHEERFLTYYVTVSGHMSYNFKSNAMARKHQDAVADLPYSEDVRAYIATQIELDQALELLLRRLEEEGILSDTVIALVGDHYPYDISLNHINEVADPDRDEEIEINRSYFVLWNADMENVTINKVGGNMDVLPTLLNLFGVPYDSRLIMGSDLLDPGDGFVIFANQSWVSSYGVYSANKRQFTKNHYVIDEDYVKKMNKLVHTKVELSKLILEKDYYRKVLGE